MGNIVSEKAKGVEKFQRHVTLFKYLKKRINWKTKCYMSERNGGGKDWT